MKRNYLREIRTFTRSQELLAKEAYRRHDTVQALSRARDAVVQALAEHETAVIVAQQAYQEIEELLAYTSQQLKHYTDRHGLESLDVDLMDHAERVRVLKAEEGDTPDAPVDELDGFEISNSAQP